MKVIAQESNLRSESEIEASSPKYKFSLKNFKIQHETPHLSKMFKTQPLMYLTLLDILT